jgi:hypothetical protein
MNEERLRTAHHDVSIFSNNAGSDWDVWLEPYDGKLVGVCVGGGATRDEAVQCAVDALETALAKLQETPSPEAEAKLRATLDTGDSVKPPEKDWTDRSYGGTTD